MCRLVVGMLLVHGVMLSHNVKLALQLASRLPRSDVPVTLSSSVAQRSYQSLSVAKAAGAIPKAKQAVLSQVGVMRARQWCNENQSVISEAAIRAMRNNVPLATALLDDNEVVSAYRLESVFRQTLPGATLLPSGVSLPEIQRLVNELVRDIYSRSQPKVYVDPHMGERLAQQWFEQNKDLITDRLQNEAVPYESFLIHDQHVRDMRLLDRALRQHIPNMSALPSQASLQDIQRLVNNYVHELHDHQLAMRMYQEEQVVAKANQGQFAVDNAAQWFGENRITLATVFNRMGLYTMESLHWIQTQYMENIDQVFTKFSRYSHGEVLPPLPQPCDNQVLMGMIHSLIGDVYEAQVERHRVNPRLGELNKHIDEGRALTIANGREYIGLCDQYNQDNTDRYRRISYWLQNKTGGYSMGASSTYFDPQVQMKNLQSKIARREGLTHAEVGQYMHLLKDVHRDYSAYRGETYYDGQENPIENQTVNYGADLGLFNKLSSFYKNPRKRNKRFHGDVPSVEEQRFDELKTKVRTKVPITHAEVGQYLRLPHVLGEEIDDAQGVEMLDWLISHGPDDMYPEVAAAPQADRFFHGQKVEGVCPVSQVSLLPNDDEEGVPDDELALLQPSNVLVLKEVAEQLVNSGARCPVTRMPIHGFKTSHDD